MQVTTNQNPSVETPQIGGDASAHLTFAFSRFKSKSDNSPKPARLDWRGLCQLLEKRRLASGVAGKDGAAIGGAFYPPHVWRREDKPAGALNANGKPFGYKEAGNPTPEDWRAPIRANDFVASVSLAILDFDNGTTLEEIETGAARLNSGDGAAAFVYSTFSHTPETPKFRVVLPLSVPVVASEWPEVWQRLALAFDEKPDRAAKDAARLHFLPSCPKSRAGDAVALEIAGECLDVATLPQLPQPETSAPGEQTRRPMSAQIGATSGDRYAEKAVTNELERLRTTSSNRNSALNTAALAIGHFVGAGRWHRSDAESALFDASAANGYLAKDGEKQTRDTIKSGLDTGERDPNYTGLPKQRPAPAGDASARQLQRQRDEQRLEEPAKFEAFTFSDLARLPRPNWLVRGLLVENTISVLTADGGSFKSFLALDLALSVATGTDFHEREVKRGAVVYVAAEGFYTVYERALAWSKARGVELPQNFHILRAPVNVSEPSQVAKFARQFKEFAPVFAVLDTLSQNAIGLNENANDEMARFMSGMAAVGVATGAHVMAVHHNAKASGAFRGAGAIKNNVDAHISLDRPEGDEVNTVFVRCEKQRGKPFDAFALRGEEVDSGLKDKFGDVVTSLVFEATGEEVTAKVAKHPNAKRADTARARLLELFDSLALENPDGVKVGTLAGLAITTEEFEGICSDTTFWRHLSALKGDTKNAQQIESCGTHNGSELWRRCHPTPTTPTTPNDSNGSAHKTASPPYSHNSHIPLGSGSSGSCGSSGAKQTNAQRQKRAKNSADAEPYKAPATSGDADEVRI